MKHDNTLFLVGRIKENVDNFIVEEMNKMGMEGLVTSHGAILYALFFAHELTMTEIAERIHRDRATVTALIKKLLKYGYVAKKNNNEDKRSSIIYLTEKGKGLEEGFFEISAKIFEIEYEGITEEERMIFRKVLNKVYENIKKQING